MAMWRCPHCSTPQHEAARCWVCHRSSTVCSTCRHFRQSLAASVGYCGLDARRSPLRGTERRGCWTESRITADGGTGAAVIGAEDPIEEIPIAVRRLRPSPRPGILEGFVPVELVERGPRVLQPTDGAQERRPAPPPPGVIETGPEAWTERDSLFGDL